MSKWKKGFKRVYALAFVSTALLLTGGVSAFATTAVGLNSNSNITDPTGLSSLAGNSSASNSTNGINQAGSVIGNVVKSFLGIVAGLTVAYTLYQIYVLAFLFFRGGTNANKRDEAKTHAIHLVIGAGIAGASGYLLALMMGLFKHIGSSQESTTGGIALALLKSIHGLH